jgi:hypothetical protein
MLTKLKAIITMAISYFINLSNYQLFKNHFYIWQCLIPVANTTLEILCKMIWKRHILKTNIVLVDM